MSQNWEALLRARFSDDLDIRHIDARDASIAELPNWLNPTVHNALTEQGITYLWQHQRDALEAWHSGDNLIVATGTASGKSLCYQIPILQSVATNPKVKALYISPTKALAHDQARALSEFGVDAAYICTFDGDSDQQERKWAREHANVLITNPDMLHHGILPRHETWQHFFRNLEVIAIDECHLYRGMFGAQVANVLRRFLRIAHHYGATPRIVMASATVSQPAEHALMLTGINFAAIDRDASPRGPLTIGLALPPKLIDSDDSQRRTAIATTADVLADLVVQKVRTLAFVKSRKSAETVSILAKQHVGEIASELTSAVTSYRAGYLPEERREIEARLRSGDLLGVATTNALELGVDISGLDATVMAGWPGTRASFWQQVGRAGRDQQEAMALLIASDNPLDQYLVRHPEGIYDTPIEAAVCDPQNSNVLYGHLACAAAEKYLTESDVELFDNMDRAATTLTKLVNDGLLRRRPQGWFWVGQGRPHDLVDLRGAGAGPFQIVELETGRLLGTVDHDAALRQVHEGAVYTHLGETYVVDQLDLDDRVSLVHAELVDYSTYARDITSVTIVEELASKQFGSITMSRGMVEVTEQVVAFQKRRNMTGQIIADVPLELPPSTLFTQAMWWTTPVDTLNHLQLIDVAGCMHAAEHAAIGLLPLFTLCDRWDIGGVSFAEHPDTGLATVFIYDGYSGGAGFAFHGYENALQWLGATRDTISDCACKEGCPACVQSPKCGNNNHPLDKVAAHTLLTYLLNN
jgi:DEAD/DEAH box helicase domain-containing protein